MDKRKLYTLLCIACLAGYSWIVGNIYFENQVKIKSTCLIKIVTGVPCPSCGSTRAIVSLLNGELVNFIYFNPLALISVVILIVVPFWIIIDIILKKDSLWVFYRKSELFFQRKDVMILSITLILINWIWNIFKGL